MRGTFALALCFVLAGCPEDVVETDSGPDSDADADEPVESCVDDAECDDSLFCNGAERCAPGAEGADPFGCLRGEAPCVAGQPCSPARRGR